MRHKKAMVTRCLMKNVADSAPSVSSFLVINYFFTRKKFRENLFNLYGILSRSGVI